DATKIGPQQSIVFDGLAPILVASHIRRFPESRLNALPSCWSTRTPLHLLPKRNHDTSQSQDHNYSQGQSIRRSATSPANGGRRQARRRRTRRASQGSPGSSTPKAASAFPPL